MSLPGGWQIGKERQKLKVEKECVFLKKVKYIALILVLTLGLIGGAYAAWTDNLKAEGTVTTGDIDVVFTEAFSNDPENTDDPISVAIGDPKDVATTTVERSDNGKKLTITITNAYPGYISEVAYCVVNKGSVPVKLQSKIPTWSPEPGLEVTNCPGWFCWLGWPWTSQNPGNPGNEEPEEEGNPLVEGSQLHQDEEFRGVIKHEITDAATQNTDYTYTIDYKFVLFNQYQQN